MVDVEQRTFLASAGDYTSAILPVTRLYPDQAILTAADILVITEKIVQQEYFF
jgi:hypothetical protein